MISIILALAATQPCPPSTPPKKPIPRKQKKKVPQKAAPCNCTPGEKGPQGERGLQGPKGDDSVSLDIVYMGEPGLSLNLGAMGAIITNGDWAWGPALQLAQPTDNGEFVVDLGLALTGQIGPGHETGYLLHAGYTHNVTKKLGVTVGLHGTIIEGSESNGETDATYEGVTAGIVLRHKSLRLEIAPLFTTDNVGLTSSLFVRI
jgi:hypothetical protein